MKAEPPDQDAGQTGGKGSDNSRSRPRPGPARSRGTDPRQGNIRRHGAALRPVAHIEQAQQYAAQGPGLRTPQDTAGDPAAHQGLLQCPDRHIGDVCLCEPI